MLDRGRLDQSIFRFYHKVYFEFNIEFLRDYRDLFVRIYELYEGFSAPPSSSYVQTFYAAMKTSNARLRTHSILLVELLFLDP
jgi:hypothetical protein